MTGNEFMAESGEAALAAMHERLMAALKASRCGTWHWDIQNDVVEWDEALSDVYGIPHRNSPRTSGEFFALIHPDDRERAAKTLGDCFASGSEVDYEFRAVVGDAVRWIYDRSSLIRDAEGAPRYMTGACLDVTERKKIEEERKAALEQQKLLLTELNHRIKNHLQMITAMLNLQAARQSNASVRADFENAIRRIHTIADLHIRLYQDDWQGQVDVSVYLKGICSHLTEALLQKTQVRLDCDISTLVLSVDQALPLGLIVNELVTNAIKYAFPANRQGRIVVRLRSRGRNVALAVLDNGTGLKKEPAKTKGGIGTRLVQSLSRQIGGRLRLTHKNGTGYHLLFRSATE
ncbi:MAG: PAS domain-containing protein [Parvibaculum sp.]|uniref:sensor histidine kinase n=1 Tax=Parvibaculum sp. TaxID=2024848 RepID=UPI0025F03501|nr:histidine kinase dimerization/phosphoacceptor domain -containing protein [Parvibaculum sp.]MCE9650512.1 PAS domain-containing protein [Parvibaculum sp.]